MRRVDRWWTDECRHDARERSPMSGDMFIIIWVTAAGPRQRRSHVSVIHLQGPIPHPSSVEHFELLDSVSDISTPYLFTMYPGSFKGGIVASEVLKSERTFKYLSFHGLETFFVLLNGKSPSIHEYQPVPRLPRFCALLVGCKTA